MKKLIVRQQLNPDFFGDSTPNIDRHIYIVLQVINSTSPIIHETMTRGAVDEYCGIADWTVTIK